MSQKIDAAVLDTIADSLERIQGEFSKLYKAAVKDSAMEAVFSKLDDIFSAEIETLHDMADNSEEDDE
jgi:hypothetical protein